MLFWRLVHLRIYFGHGVHWCNPLQLEKASRPVGTGGSEQLEPDFAKGALAGPFVTAAKLAIPARIIYNNLEQAVRYNSAGKLLSWQSWRSGRRSTSAARGQPECRCATDRWGRVETAVSMELVQRAHTQEGLHHVESAEPI